MGPKRRGVDVAQLDIHCRALYLFVNVVSVQFVARRGKRGRLLGHIDARDHQDTDQSAISAKRDNDWHELKDLGTVGAVGGSRPRIGSFEHQLRGCWLQRTRYRLQLATCGLGLCPESHASDCCESDRISHGLPTSPQGPLIPSSGRRAGPAPGPLPSLPAIMPPHLPSEGCSPSPRLPSSTARRYRARQECVTNSTSNTIEKRSKENSMYTFGRCGVTARRTHSTRKRESRRET